ncbi:exported hypothetical protein [Azospirillaceae bacterium]
MSASPPFFTPQRLNVHTQRALLSLLKIACAALIAVLCAHAPTYAQQAGGGGNSGGGKPAGTLGANQARGQLAARREITLSSEINGRIDRLPLVEGARFKRGDELVHFDCALYDAQRAGAEAGVRGAQATLEANRRLAAMKSIGQLEVSQAEAAIAKARADLRVAQIMADRCSVRAPFDGQIATIKAKEGETLNSSQALLEIVEDHALEIKLIVPSAWLTWLNRGESFKFRIDETGGEFVGRVTMIGARVDPGSQSIQLTGEMVSQPFPPHEGNERRLAPGMSGTATMRIGAATAAPKP